MSPGPALSRVATRSIRVAPSPSTAAPQSRPSSSRRIGPPGAHPVIGLLVGERLDHLVGDIDALARVDDRVLQDQIVLLARGDLLDHLVRTVLQRRDLLVLPEIDVLTELALHPLHVARLMGEIALLASPVNVRHRRT